MTRRTTTEKIVVDSAKAKARKASAEFLHPTIRFKYVRRTDLYKCQNFRESDLLVME